MVSISVGFLYMLIVILCLFLCIIRSKNRILSSSLVFIFVCKFLSILLVYKCIINKGLHSENNEMSFY